MTETSRRERLLVAAFWCLLAGRYVTLAIAELRSEQLVRGASSLALAGVWISLAGRLHERGLWAKRFVWALTTVAALLVAWSMI